MSKQKSALLTEPWTNTSKKLLILRFSAQGEKSIKNMNKKKLESYRKTENYKRFTIFPVNTCWSNIERSQIKTVELFCDSQIKFQCARLKSALYVFAVNTRWFGQVKCCRFHFTHVLKLFGFNLPIARTVDPIKKGDPSLWMKHTKNSSFE